MGNALPAWDETEPIEIPRGTLPSFEETTPIEPEVMPADFTPSPDVSKLESLARGGAQGLSLGFADEITGAGETGLDLLTGDASVRDIVTQYLKNRDESRAAYKTAKEANPGTYLAGQIGGGAIGALATPGLTAGKLGAVALKTGAMGAAQGVGESDADLLSAETAKQALMSGGMGAAFGAGATAIANKFRPTALDETAMSAGRRALGFTKRLQNTPLKEKQADQAVRLALDQDILKPFAEPTAMQDAAESVAKKSGRAMGKFLGKESGAFDPNRAIADIETLRPAGLDIGDNADINRIINKTVDTIKSRGKLTPTGEIELTSIPWEDARQLKSQIQGMANYDTAASREVNEMKKRLGGKIRDSFMAQLEDNATARGGRKGFEEFAKNVKNFGSAETLQDALQNRISSDQGNAVFGLRDVIFGSGALGATGNYGKAAMTAAAFKVGRRYGNQTLSWSADRLSKAIQASPQSFQKWLPALRTAMVRGPQALAVTSFILQQSDPAYSETISTMSEGD